LFKEDASVDDLIDVILGNRKYVPCLYVYTKIDSITIEEVDRLARLPHSIVISCDLQLNLDGLLEAIWQKLGLVRVYTKRRGEYPDFSDGIVLRRGATVEHVCHSIHRSLKESFRYALVWGASSKHQPQRAGLTHSLCDEDVVQIVKKN
jgi:ribosome-interacting GTPase 1